MSALPPLATDPKYGYFRWWPDNSGLEDSDAWLHPADVATARAMIPSGRVFRREGTVGEFGLFHYGDVTLRAKPVLWQEIEPEGFEIGDWVEVRTRGMANEPRTGTIAEMMWDEHAGEIRYQIVENGARIDTDYARDDLKPVDPPSLSR
jgi:hypothetical protein